MSRFAAISSILLDVLNQTIRFSLSPRPSEMRQMRRRITETCFARTGFHHDLSRKGVIGKRGKSPTSGELLDKVVDLLSITGHCGAEPRDTGRLAGVRNRREA
ncbi:hypothetical protein AB0I53_09765 [Saccharopolyspora sp. NPDC050389]|uniref:hypothetical protein n=1 Tax=Saccharopolyspora sp. NPDC050389 TaxID=3155516 RepID=UPI0033CCDE3F